MIALLGFGKTNQALLEYINNHAQCCIVCDDKFKNETKDEFGNIFTHNFLAHQTHMQIPSPGIPPQSPMIIGSSNLVSEYDFLLCNLQEKQVWISGTNGKTTTTEMTEWLLKDFGGMAGGNIGIPLAYLHKKNPKIWILETSSFSLHYTKNVFPHCYVLLPLSEDHISWHGSFNAYVNDKLSVLERMKEDGVAFIPERLSSHFMVKNFRGRLFLYKDSYDLARQMKIPYEKIFFNEPFLLDALLALSVSKILTGKLDLDLINKYQIGEHKMQEFFDSKKRLWVNDSKGTNIDATSWVVKNYANKRIYLILGGDDKGADLRPLFEDMQGRDIHIFAIGKNSNKILDHALSYGLECEVCEFLQKAVDCIDQVHSCQSVAILSPAAASLDQFDSYRQRGEQFMYFVKNLGKER